MPRIPMLGFKKDGSMRSSIMYFPSLIIKFCAIDKEFKVLGLLTNPQIGACAFTNMHTHDRERTCQMNKIFARHIAGKLRAPIINKISRMFYLKISMCYN